MRLNRVQIILILKEIINRPDTIIKELNDSMANLFDSSPIILPMPENLPLEIPVVQLKNNSNNYFCNISRNRIEIAYSPINISNIDKTKEDYMIKFKNFIKFTTSKFAVNRIGFVSHYLKEAKNPANIILQKYFKDLYKDFSEINLRFNKHNKFKNYKLNDVITINSIKLNVSQTENNLQNGILVIRDINTPQNDGIVMNNSELCEFINEFKPFHSLKAIEEMI